MKETWTRHRADVARTSFAAVTAVFFVLLVVGAPGENVAISRGVLGLFDLVPIPFTRFIIGIVQLLALIVPSIVVMALAVRRRFRVIGLLALAAVIGAAAFAMLNMWLATKVPHVVVVRRSRDSWITGASFPSTAYLSAAMAAVTAGGAWLRPSWRRAAWAGLAAVAFCRLLAGTEVPIGVALTLAVGATAGSLALVIVGAPLRRIDDDALRTALAGVGVDVSDIDLELGPNGAVAFRATADDGAQLRVRVIGRDERDAATLLRAWHALTRKGLGDHRPVQSPRRSAEHQMAALALAASAGARVPQPVAIAFTPAGAALAVLRVPHGVALAQEDPASVDDRLLIDVWQQVGALQLRRIAHRALDDQHVLIDTGNGTANGEHASTLFDFSVATLDASDEVLAADVANLLTSLATRIGVDRATRTAIDGLGTDRVAAALPLLQTPVLTPAVRRECHDARHLTGEVRSAAQEATGVDKVELTRVRRVTLKGIVALVGSIVLAGYLLNLVTNWPDTWHALRQAEPSDLVALLVLVVAAYAGGALSLMGAVVIDLPFARTLEILFAQSFLNRFTPANSGGMALRVRYLQVEGAPVAEAAAAVGLTAGAEAIAQTALVALFLVWGGTTDSLGKFSLPSKGKALIGVIIIGAIIGAFALSRWGRRVALPAAARTTRSVVSTIVSLARRPEKIALLFGGAFLTKLVGVLSFALCVRALGVHMGIAQAGALFMVATSVGAAVPTPGGVGGVEAALTAALLGAGVDGATAAAIVVLYRTVTFWLPTLPAWFALQHAQRSGIV